MPPSLGPSTSYSSLQRVDFLVPYYILPQRFVNCFLAGPLSVSILQTKAWRNISLLYPEEWSLPFFLPVFQF